MGSVVYVVDDDASVRVALKKLLTLAGLRAEVFGSIEEFLETPQPEGPSCLVLDVRLPGMNGLDFQEELARKGVSIQIIFITAQGDSPMTRRAMKAGAVDFLTKPFRKKDLLAAIHQALDRDRSTRASRAEVALLRARYDTLTAREREVLALVATGMPNKQVGAQLGMSEATVKIHRRHIVAKMQAASLLELAKMAETLKANADK